MKVCHLHFMVTEGTSVDMGVGGVPVDLRAHFKSGLPTHYNEMPNDRLQFCSIRWGGGSPVIVVPVNNSVPLGQHFIPPTI